MRFFWQTFFAAAANLLLMSSIFYFLFSGPLELPVSEDEIEKELLFTQERLFLTKDLLYASPEGERMQMRMRGKKGSLTIVSQGKGHQIKERMSGIKGYFQERFYQTGRPMQDVDYFEAGVADYDNRTGHIVAGDVQLFKVALPGHGKVDNLKLGERVAEGSCKELEFSLKQPQVQVTAKGFHGQFQEGIRS